jgi:hypothetical protein
MRFQVLTAASMKMLVFWDMAQFSLVEVERIVLIMQTVSTSETSVYFIETTRRNISEGSNLHFGHTVY